MTIGMRTVIHPVKDLTAAKAVYGALLGVEPSVDQPYYVGFDLAGVHLGLDPNGHQKGMTGSVAFWEVEDIAAALERLTAVGAETVQPAGDVGGGRVVATMRDADGNMFGLMQDR